MLNDLVAFLHLVCALLHVWRKRILQRLDPPAVFSRLCPVLSAIRPASGPLVVEPPSASTAS